MTQSPTLNPGLGGGIPLTQLPPTTGPTSPSTPTVPPARSRSASGGSAELQGLTSRTPSASASVSPRRSLDELRSKSPTGSGSGSPTALPTAALSGSTVPSPSTSQTPATATLPASTSAKIGTGADAATASPTASARPSIEAPVQPSSSQPTGTDLSMALVRRSSSADSVHGAQNDRESTSSYVRMEASPRSSASHANEVNLGSQVTRQRDDLRASLSQSSGTSDHAHVPKEAGQLEFFLAQNKRHFGSVAVVRTVVQGLASPEVARLVESHPQAAVALQLSLAIASALRRAGSQFHSERNPAVANRAFAGDISGQHSSLQRRVWQGIQTAGILLPDAASVALTLKSTQHPALVPLAQSFAAIQVLSHLQAGLREFCRPLKNTVHVGNGDASVPQPPEGRNLTASDIPWTLRAKFGTAAAGIDFAAQLMQQFAMGGQPAWNSHRGLALLSGAIGGLANMLTSSVEDHLVDRASARRMQQTDPSHVAHLHDDKMQNPFSRYELGRQNERVDARVFNTMIPSLAALGVMQLIQQTAKPNADGSRPPGQIAAQAAVHAVCAGLILGSLLALTVKSYQLNDDVRKSNRNARAAQTAANANPA